jgi:hypothetical protein
MYMTKLGLLFLMVSMSHKTNSFDWSKCRQLLNKDQSMTGGGASLSSSGFSSSIGACSALGSNLEEERKLFYTFNYNYIKSDIAKGGGENLISFLVLSDCESKVYPPMAVELKKNMM